MRVAVIGATGQLGQDLMRAFGEGAKGLSHEDVDVRDEAGVAAAIGSLRPDWVLNTAAFHRVDDCETDPGLAFAVNAVGALNVARAAADVGAGVVFFSTDYVFGGEGRERGHPYEEGDRTSPLNVYGVSKRAGEQLVMRANPRHIVARTTGLYGTTTSRKGWTFPELMLNKARDEGSVSVVTDQALSPTYTSDLAAKVRELAEKDVRGLFHLTNAGECSWFEFAEATFGLAGVEVEMNRTQTQHSDRRAHRPAYSAMETRSLPEAGISPLRPWREALEDYLRAKEVIR